MSSTYRKVRLISILCLQCMFILISSVSTSKLNKKNVLFIMADDLRPAIGAYMNYKLDESDIKIHTPNLDALAKKSILFNNAYTQQAVCSPSRTSLLTGRRPDTTHVFDLVTYFRHVSGNFTTLPQYFKQNGYSTIGMGKIFHPGGASGHDDPVSWTEKYFHAKEFKKHYQYIPYHTWFSVNQSMWSQYPLQDMETTNHALEVMKKVAPGGRSGIKPFFMAVGFHKPHLPFIVPDKFYKYYPLSKMTIAPNQFTPVNLPPIAWSNFDELRRYHDIGRKYGYGIINATLPNDVQKLLRRGYYAAVSYIDDLVGQLLFQLKRLDLEKNTIVSFISDHGWQLGEHGEWCKHTNFEEATRVPVMISIPGLTNVGIKSDALIELVDIFPTLVDASGLDKLIICPENKSSQTLLCTEGASVLPLIINGTKTWKKAVFSQYPRMAMDGNIYMGYSMRTRNYRFTEWIGYSYYENHHRSWSDIFHKFSVELYDHRNDPQENFNRAFDDSYQKIRLELSEQLHAGWRNVF